MKVTIIMQKKSTLHKKKNSSPGSNIIRGLYLTKISSATLQSGIRAENPSMIPQRHTEPRSCIFSVKHPSSRVEHGHIIQRYSRNVQSSYVLCCRLHIPFQVFQLPSQFGPKRLFKISVVITREAVTPWIET